MPSASSYHIATTDGGTGTKVDDVTLMTWEDGVLRLEGDGGVLFVAPLHQIAYVKQVAPSAKVADLRRAWEKSEEECAKLRRSNDGRRRRLDLAREVLRKLEKYDDKYVRVFTPDATAQMVCLNVAEDLRHALEGEL